MESITELIRRLIILWIWLTITLRCLIECARAATPARPAPLPGSMLRHDFAAAGHLAGRLIAIRLQLVIIPIGGAV